MKRLINIHNCTNCSDLLQSTSTTIENNKQMYTHFKAYPVKNKVSSFGNLLLPTATFYNFLMNCETIFSEYFSTHAADKNVVSNLCHKLNCLPLSGVCGNFPKTELLTFFAKLRIDYTLKFSNREFATIPKTQRKLLKINGL